VTKNDILRRIRYIFDINDNKMIKIFGLADLKVNRQDISDWLKKEDDPAFIQIRDIELASFLNGFINHKRGKREGEQPKPEERLDNNIIFKKLKIALSLQSDEVLELLNQDDFYISQHELSAFFRKKGHKHYRECQNQILRNFLNGLQNKYRSPNNEQ
jgi:uncharacterized protein YehS (DUF1456 family)